MGKERGGRKRGMRNGRKGVGVRYEREIGGRHGNGEKRGRGR